MNPPRIMIAGASSGAGKSTISLGLMAALAGRGLEVRPFKTGPDYIDPGLHRAACGRVSHNLDPWLMPEGKVRDLFQRHSSGLELACASGQIAAHDPGRATDKKPGPVSAQKPGLAIVEGAMGLFDGLDAGAFASSAHVACLIKAPVLLVINARGMGLSAAALALGFASFKPRPPGPDLSGLHVAGVIFNMVSGARHAAMLRRALAGHSHLPCLGCLPKNAVPPLPERHLGLTPAAELPHLERHLEILAGAVEEHLDLEALLALALNAAKPPQDGASTDCAGPAGTCARPAETRNGPSTDCAGPVPSSAPSCARVPEKSQLAAKNLPFAGLRLGLGLDAAFSFYYQDGLDLLSEAGVELVPFSPLSDSRLPENLHGLYLGGGFPEMFAAELAANKAMRAALRAALEDGLPAYAECGGLLYLCASLEGGPGAAGPQPMAGFFPQRAAMGGALRAFGYLELTLERDCLLGRAGQRLRAHEFHYAQLESGPEPAALFTAFKSDGRSWTGGLSGRNCVAWFPHLHFRGCPEAAHSFLSACDAFRKQSANRASRT